MGRFEYVGWIVDHRLPADDRDAEWPVVLVIEAPSSEAARSYGDALAAQRFPPRDVMEFSWSVVAPTERSLTPGLDEFPVLEYAAVPITVERDG